MSVRINFILSKDMHIGLKEQARKRGATMSGLIRVVLAEWLENNNQHGDWDVALPGGDQRSKRKFYSVTFEADTYCPVCSGPRYMGNGNEHIDCNNLLARDKHGVFAEAGYKCLHCGEADPATLTIDHIIPQIHGGSNHPTNLQSLCQSCNSRKGARSNESSTI